MTKKYLQLGTLILSLCLTIIGIVLFGTGQRAHADTVPVFIAIDGVLPVKSGEPFQVTGGLFRKTGDGQAGVAQRGVDLYIEPDNISDGPITKTTRLARVFSDEEGRLTWTIHKQLAIGHYRLYYIYEGSPLYNKASAVTDIVVLANDAAKIKPESKLADVKIRVSISNTRIISGEPIYIVARLSDMANRALVGQAVRVKLPDATQQEITDRNGVVVLEVKHPLPAGKHVALLMFGGAPGFATAKQAFNINVEPPLSTTLSFAQRQERLYVGSVTSLTVRLLAEQDQTPIKAELLRYFLDGEFRYGVYTDPDGHAVLKLPRDITAGTHIISVTYHGTGGLYGTERLYAITALPRPFEIQTIPPLPHVKIQVGRQTIETDPQGIARLLVEQGGEQPVRVLPYVSSTGDDDRPTRATFERWSDDVYSATRTINVTNGKTYQIGFTLSHPIATTFFEANTGRSVSPKRLSDIRLVANTGERVELDALGQTWVIANRIVKRENKLESSPVTYYIEHVGAEGINVVNESQQKFEVRPKTEWRIKLQLHDLKITAYDAVFGFPVGNSVQLVHPNGVIQQLALNERSQTQVQSLARGAYTVTVSGVMGMRVPLPVSLSQNQDMQAAVITYFDIVVVGMALIVIVIVTLFVGRPHPLRGLRRSA